MAHLDGIGMKARGRYRGASDVHGVARPVLDQIIRLFFKGLIALMAQGSCTVSPVAGTSAVTRFNFCLFDEWLR
jgi:hypothetical protein